MKTKVLMVCLGNICRSPLAEGILKSKVDLDKVYVDSAGTAGYHLGNPPDERSIAVAKKYGLDISSQKCRRFSSMDFDKFDWIYVMDKSNFSDIVQLANNEKEAQKVRLLLDEIDLNLDEVPDPYHGGSEGFEYVYQLINTACDSIAAKLG